jgi:alpha-L-rhamnosidase
MTARITRLRAELRPDAFAVGVDRPRLSWVVGADGEGLTQVAYEIEVARRGGTTTTGRVSGDGQVFVDWPVEPLVSRERVVVRVRAWLSGEVETPWSEPLAVEASLLEEADWSTDFVSPSVSAPAEGVRPGYLLRADVDIPVEVVAARLYATAHGIYRMEINGERVGDDELAPGWTSYGHRLRFQTYDVTHLLTAGANALGAELSDGWYRGRIGFHGGIWDNYGEDLALLAQLEIEFADGRRHVIPVSDRWRWSSGPVVAASLYDGEHYDAGRVPEGWSRPGFDDGDWSTPTVLPRTRFSAQLEPAIGVPVRIVEELVPVSVEHRPDGRIRLDFGQNVAGWLAIRVSGPGGHEVVLHHAEALEDDELAIRPLRSAPSIDRYRLSGAPGGESWRPRFTIHGFRYAELENWPGEFTADAVRAQVVHSDMERTGWFASSDPLVNRLHENALWSMRGNFVDLPTDCPQRDERLGWTGDIQVFAPAASFLYSSGGTLTSWLRDLSVEQGADGWVPNFVPWVECGFPRDSSAAWGDAAVVVPWVMYQRNGDLGILREQFPSMALWVEHFASKADDSGLVREGMQLGDWLDPAAPPEDPGAGLTDRYLVASAYLAYSADLTARAALLLGRPADHERYDAVARRTADAFRREYVTQAGRMAQETPTALSLAIAFDLITDPAQRAVAGRRLADLVREGGYRIQTGFVGTPLICDALAATGQIDVAYRLLLERECPSWLYPVTMGATTIWERWDSMLPDGSVNPGEMTSFNHYALGAVVDFLHRTLAGLAPASPGYQSLLIAPQPGEHFDSAQARLETPYGTAAVSWTRSGEEFRLDATVPVGVTAEVVLPDGSTRTVGSGEHRFLATIPAASAA